MPGSTNEEDVEVEDSSDDASDTDEEIVRPGRIENGSFDFHPKHPLFLTHCQRLRSKTKVPVLLRSPPRCPPSKPEKLTDEWRRTARQFARYMLVLFKPWRQEDGTAPGDLTWTELCLFMDELEFGEDRSGPTIVETARRRWIENTSQGILNLELINTSY